MEPTSRGAVADGMVVSIHYTVTGDDGTVFDSSQGGAPLDYLHGSGNLVPGLERGLAGRCAGDKLQVEVAPRDGYGERDPKGVARVPRDSFPDDMELEEGMQFGGEDEQGREMVVWIAAIEADAVVVDRNHPLSGKTLHFDVSIEGVRPATREEIAHGHAHGAHGHHHH